MLIRVRTVPIPLSSLPFLFRENSTVRNSSKQEIWVDLISGTILTSYDWENVTAGILKQRFNMVWKIENGTIYIYGSNDLNSEF